MNQYFIRKYIEKLTVNDIDAFAKSQQTMLSPQECSYLLSIIQHHYQELLYGDPMPIFNQAKEHMTEEHVDVAIKLYHFYKEKYQAFL